MAQTKKQIGSRGKAAEAEVQAILEEWNRRMSHFAFERLPDARAARGAIKAQVADFMLGFSYDSAIGGEKRVKHFVLLEVKETAHEYRLTKDKVEQLPRINKWVSACADGFVLVHHSVLKQWRLVNASLLTIGLPSWDLRPFPLFPTAKDALLSHDVFAVMRRYR